ncbi:unnamed protein product [Rotaria sordida]|uniref:Uncharacterized protein n=1 Tax=Rotaria sordida TaxID=392033 RepID=A0A815PUW2_9BILA|nr:unnamed protein product [Rotaria sordida]CAF1640142.1 unnamed protein product [Rotaria sordida]
MNAKFTTSNMNIHPTHMSTIHPVPLTTKTTTSSYINLRSNVNPKYNLYDAGQRKNNYPYKKFQTGSTTTFSGYTYISSYKNINNYNRKNDNIKSFNTMNNNNNNIKIPALMSIDRFQQPPRKNRRSLYYAQQYYKETQNTYQHHHHTILPTTTAINEHHVLILSDSMCKYVRVDKISPPNMKINISFESGCNCSRMLEFLEQQNIEQSQIFNVDFIIFSLCTNDVSYLELNQVIEHCRYLIQRTRQLFPKIKAIGWLALSPRSKPSRLYNSSSIDEINKKFNQLLQILSKQMNFEVINANLQHQHMHQDGLHPAIQSGRILFEKALYNWLCKQNKKFSPHLETGHNNILNNNDIPTTTTNMNNYNISQPTSKKYNKPLTIQPTIQFINNNHNNNNDDNNKPRYGQKIYERTKQQQQQQQHHQHQQQINNNRNNQFTLKQKYNLMSRNVLISHYPHLLRHKEEFFRKITIPTELENEKDSIFQLSNLHFQTEYFKSESEKWKIYMRAATGNKIQSRNQIESILIDNNDSSLPIARPSLSGLAEPPAPLDFSEFSELFDEWLPEPVPGQKRKLGHRQDDPPTPPPPRQPPPIIPRKTLPPRNSNVPLRMRSLQSSLILNSNDEKISSTHRQQSFNVLLPREKEETEQEKERQQMESSIAIVARECSMAISPLQSSTPEQLIKSPSVIPKQPIATTMNESFDFVIIPIECRYYFKKQNKKCTYNTIRMHQEFLENKYKQLEQEREIKLQTSFAQHLRTKVISLIINIVEKPLANKKNNDQRRLDNLLLDQRREKAARQIKNIGTLEEQQHIQIVHEKFMSISFPPQENNKTLILQDTEAKVLNLGPKFVPPSPQQVLKRLPKEINDMKEKVAAA